MAKELIAFLNFKFEQKMVQIKSVSGDSVAQVSRFVINWREYQDVLEAMGLKASLEDRPLFQRYISHKPDEDFFKDLVAFQAELKSLLARVAQERTMPASFWKRVFRDTNGLPMIVEPDSDGDLSPKKLAAMRFNYVFSADSYRLFILAEVRGLIINKRIFDLTLSAEGFFDLPDFEPTPRGKPAAALSPAEKPEAPPVAAAENLPAALAVASGSPASVAEEAQAGATAAVITAAVAEESKVAEVSLVSMRERAEPEEDEDFQPGEALDPDTREYAEAAPQSAREFVFVGLSVDAAGNDEAPAPLGDGVSGAGSVSFAPGGATSDGAREETSAREFVADRVARGDEGEGLSFMFQPWRTTGAIEAEPDISFEPVAPGVYAFKPGMNFSSASPAPEAAEGEEPLPLTHRLDATGGPAPEIPQAAEEKRAVSSPGPAPAEEEIPFATVSIKKPLKNKLPLEPRIATLEQRKKRKGAAKGKTAAPDKGAAKGQVATVDKDQANDEAPVLSRRFFDF
ncbi:MAG: hypothetical protein LBS31_10760 [Candidatus Adiutrix sp.]|jgi:hypothetical protein|nr:hypothetical protein [Candidatus Adiutrix sp.]